jgi:hypothetical protein
MFESEECLLFSIISVVTVSSACKGIISTVTNDDHYISVMTSTVPYEHKVIYYK